MGELELDLVFDAERGMDAFVATYRNAEGGAVALREWVAAVSTDLAADIPESLRVGLTDAKFVRVKPAAGPAVFAVGFDLSAGIDLGRLPLIGGFLSEVGALGVDNLQILYSTAAIDATTSAALDALLARAEVVPLPSAGLTSGWNDGCPHRNRSDRSDRGQLRCDTGNLIHRGLPHTDHGRHSHRNGNGAGHRHHRGWYQ
nr:hypothetical protein [Nocardia exalbida]